MPSELQLQLIDLQANGLLKEKHREGKLFEFYCCLPNHEFLKLKKFASGMASMFATTYVCEQTFSKMKSVKSKHRTRFTDEHLKAILLVQCSNTEPNIEDIMKNKNNFINRTNHLLNFALLFSFRLIDFLDLFNKSSQ